MIDLFQRVHCHLFRYGRHSFLANESKLPHDRMTVHWLSCAGPHGGRLCWPPILLSGMAAEAHTAMVCHNTPQGLATWSILPSSLGGTDLRCAAGPTVINKCSGS